MSKLGTVALTVVPDSGQAGDVVAQGALVLSQPWRALDVHRSEEEHQQSWGFKAGSAV